MHPAELFGEDWCVPGDLDKVMPIMTGKKPDEGG